ncbi:NAD(P)/FAD-dependent oxidoreductase [Phreatobacter stygius]|uniref:NAD(P)/FAD-dependent oxidoreductase n=1 Tax=Phreatobacter stygius TaxID=1940610 RepID=UPI001FE30383|nr:FAD-dependent oxidoreductase [Phreatobacter stygius]
MIGGGIAGCTLAYELASRNVKTVVLEQNWVAAESSGRNTGTLLSGPQREVVELLDACAAIYEELAEGPVPFEFARIGHLLISEDEASFEAAGAVADRYRAAGVGMEKVSGAVLARDHPRLGFNVAGGYFVERAWSLEPMGATHAFAHAAREAGATIRTGLRVAQICARNGKVEGVLTDGGIIAADLVFIANGLWMNDLLRRTVGDGPLPGLQFTAGRGWLIQLGKLDFELPWIVEELTWPDQEELGRRMSLDGLADVAAQRDDQPAVEAICLNPMRGGDARLGASVQPAFRDLVRNTDMASRIAGRTLRMLPGLGSPRVTNVYPGNRPMLPDGLPVAGRTAVEGLFVHGGMGSIGMHAAPATARWLVDAVMSGDGNPAKAWLCPHRFPGWRE